MNDYPIVTDENVRGLLFPEFSDGYSRGLCTACTIHFDRSLYRRFYCYAFVFGWPSIIAVINYVERSDVRGTYLDSHFSWQIRTFWYALLWIVIVWILGLALSPYSLSASLFGLWVLLLLGIWVCYRIPASNT